MFIMKLNKSVILTYLSVAFGILGMVLALKVKVEYALICLVIAGILDLFDGVVARKIKRTEEEKSFGVQIDSLCDVINFLVFPVIITISLGMHKWYHILVLVLYALAGVTRLARFNVIAEKKHKDTPVKYYTGLPVTYISLILPIVYLIYKNVIILALLIVAIMFVTNIKITKPKGKAYIFFPLLAIVIIGILVSTLI